MQQKKKKYMKTLTKNKKLFKLHKIKKKLI